MDLRVRLRGESDPEVWKDVGGFEFDQGVLIIRAESTAEGSCGAFVAAYSEDAWLSVERM